MKKGMIPAAALACLLAATAVSAAEKKDKTLIDLKALQADNVALSPSHKAMVALGERIHGGAFGPWRCQVKIMDRRGVQEKLKTAGHEGGTSSHFLSLSIMDPASGKGLSTGNGSVTVSGPGKKKQTVDLVNLGGPFSADLDMPDAGVYDFRIDFTSGKKKASVKFSYNVK